MVKDPLVSVIMPTYNRAHLIIESLDCVLSQTYSNWECIIVNDGSKDNTEDVLKPCIEKDSRFKYFKKPNEGAAIARNFAVLKSKGIYILPLDSDDLIGLNYIEKAVNIFNSNPEVSIVYSKAKKIGVESGEWNLPNYKFDKFLIYNMIFNSSMYKRVDFDRVGGYNEENMFEDWDLWIKILKPNGTVYQIPEILYFYRTHSNHSVSTQLALDEVLYKKSMDQLYKNNVDAYLEYIGNPIMLERERRQLASIVKTADYKLAVRIMNSKAFRFLRGLRNSFKRQIK